MLKYFDSVFTLKSRKAWASSGAVGASTAAYLVSQGQSTFYVVLGTLGTAFIAFAVTYATPNAS